MNHSTPGIAIRFRTIVNFLSLACVLGSSTQGDDSLLRHIHDNLTVELVLQPTPHFVITGLENAGEKQTQELVTFSVHNTQLDQPPPILGRYEWTRNRLEFHPRFPLSKSVVYRANLAKELLPSSTDDSLLMFSLAHDANPPHPRVEAIYPTADSLPENLLKFYIYFSQPMSRAEAYKRIHLLNGSTEIDEPFLELAEELWNSDQTRFTLFIHPGRIKRGVQPRELKGPPLSSGKTYTLRVDADWTDANGCRLITEVEKKFSVTASEHSQLDPLLWKIDTPRVDTRQPVRLTFDRPLDQAMLHRVLEVKFNDGTAIDGSVALGENELQWMFTPEHPWQVGAHNIEVETTLEDLCGNNIAAPFEVKLGLGATETPPAKISIAFLIK